jgi:serine/threonine-protein kinase RsbW
MPDEPHSTGWEGGTLRLVFPSDPMAVRDALRLLVKGLPDDGANQGMVELVLAEVLNNVVEHAYADGNGKIELTIQLTKTDLRCAIVDEGCPMPDGKLPAGNLDAAFAADGLPEGGFGWHLIRSLSQDLRYDRHKGRNHLSFRLVGSG